MKAVTIALAFLLFSQALHAHCGKAFHLSEVEKKALIAKADAGEADAAYRMWNYHSMSSRDEKQATRWLGRAAELGHTEAQRWLAHMIAENGSPHQTFGKTPQEADLKLLTDSSKTDGHAASDLGELYQEGYFGQTGKDRKARAAYLHAASLHCAWNWDSLAAMLHNGEGGDADQVEAYYYICLDTQCTHPESVGGQEIWELRRKIEAKLSLDQAKEVWRRVDVYISRERKRSGGRIYPPPLLGTGIPERQWNEYLKTTDEYEARHRKHLEATMSEQGGGGQPATRSESK